MKKIGIVGCSAEGAALCYTTICSESIAKFGNYQHPDISMHTPSLSLYVDALNQGDKQSVARLMLDSVERLKAAGAEFVICPDNTIHQAFSLVEPHSSLPWLHIAEVVAQHAKTKGYKKVGVLGTQWLTESDVYPVSMRNAGIEAVLPNAEQRKKVGELIMNELVLGRTPTEAIEYLQSVIEDFQNQGCEAVVLGCTELPIVLSDENSPIPTLDSTRLLARAAIEYVTL
ncbi:amino acid racemase [Vibrio sp. SCSIO 43132]|uniref:aspartate/glutamate racemase family protein n=1 Tax=Vibrio sp. SCSIO 43132 TaxID=2779363 RepID=UPI001CA803C2|nr:amino acid racemase [Vibrio sp. SCSIO 43132]UAB72649.1 amino acid racemase [Vibrio sp. SCSIO 43132]